MNCDLVPAFLASSLANPIGTLQLGEFAGPCWKGMKGMLKNQLIPLIHPQNERHIYIYIYIQLTDSEYYNVDLFS